MGIKRVAAAKGVSTRFSPRDEIGACVAISGLSERCVERAQGHSNVKFDASKAASVNIAGMPSNLSD